MQVYSIFLDKDVYFFNGPCYLNGIPFKNLAEYIRRKKEKKDNELCI